MPISTHKFIIPEYLHGQRLDKALSLLCQGNPEHQHYSSRSQIQKIIRRSGLLINKVIISDLSYTVKENDELTLITESDAPVSSLVPANIPLDIVYEDEDLIVTNKPCNMTTHPGSGNYKDTLVNALLYHSRELSDIGGNIRPGIVHRLDKDTSGLMVVAKNNAIHKALAAQIEARVLKRKYKALVWGMMTPQEGVIDIPIARSKTDRKKMTTVRFGGKAAITHYRTLEIFLKGMFSLLECSLETGRTHQIRVHLSHTGHSVVGDQTYGNNRRKIAGCQCSEELKTELMRFGHQALHSFYIGFIHPATGRFMEFQQELTKDFRGLVGEMKSSLL